jgi:N-acetylneuraminate lyase
MNEKYKNRLKGIMVPIVSPCDERGVFDEAAFANLAGYLCQRGIHGLYVCGSTGDGYKMHASERKRATELAVAACRKHDATVIVHVGAYGSRDAMALAAHAADAGADAVASIRPPNSSHSQLMQYYRDIHSASHLPMLVYHIPHLSGVCSTFDELVELLDIEGVVGLKGTDWNLYLLQRLLRMRPDIVVFNGFDEMVCPALLYGCSGAIGSHYNLFPGLFLGIYAAIQRRDIASAMRLQNSFNEFVDCGWQWGIPAVLEHILCLRRQVQWVWRRPRPELSAEAVQWLEKHLLSKLETIEQEQERVCGVLP